MDFVDVDSDKWQYAAFKRFPVSSVHRREGRTLRAHERRFCEKAACIVATPGCYRQLELLIDWIQVRNLICPNQVKAEIGIRIIRTNAAVNGWSAPIKLQGGRR